MAATDRVFLADRVKELSYDTGNGNFQLDGAAKGFAAFGDFYAYDSAVYYAITDGTDWEVGSGQYILDGATNALRRHAFSSSNGNNNVNFNAGIKEVFVTYPGAFAVFTSNGIDEFQSPRSSGIAFWGSQQTLDYDPKLIWDTGTDRLGIGYAQPSYEIDVAGDDAAWSMIRSSGSIVGESGVMFSGVDPAHKALYSGGIQLEPFMRNVLDTDSGADLIFDLGGLVDQKFVLRQQKEGQIWAGPASGDCMTPPCPDDYPQFRYLVQDDIPDLRELYVRQHNDPNGNDGTLAIYRISGEIQYDEFLRWDRINNYLGVNRDDPQWTLDVDGNSSISGSLDILHSLNVNQGNLSVSGNLTVSGNLDVQGNVTYVDSATMTILDPQIQLGSLSGTAVYTDAQIDNGGIVLQTTDSDDPKEWIWKDAIDSWDTKEGVRASGDVISSGFLTVARDVVFAENLTTSGTIGVSGAAQFDDTLKASGNVIFGNTLRVTSDLETSGTFQASGNSIIDANLTVQKKFFVFEDSYFVGATTTSGNFNASGISTFNNDVYFTSLAPVVASGTVGISGTTTLDGNLIAQKKVFVTEDSYFLDTVTASGAIGVSGAAQFDDTIDASGDVTLGNDLWVTNKTTVSGDFHASGQTILNGGLDTYSGDLSLLPGAGNGAGNIVINSSGFLTIPIFQSATDLTNTLPVAEWTSGAFMFIHDSPNKAMAFCDGYAWSSGHFETV